MAPAISAALNDLAAFFAARGVAAWLVGGAARDLARGRTPTDLDLAVAGDGLGLAREFANRAGGAFVRLDAPRGTGRVVLPGPPALTIDIAALRAPTIEGDLQVRDFTVNALAIPLATHLPGGPDGAPPGPVVDPTGGLADLAAGVLRPCGPLALADDPLRVLRAGRLCATLGLQPVAELESLMASATPGLDTVAPERVRDELLKLLDAPASAPWLRYLDACGALSRVFPELEPARACAQPRVHFLPVLAHMLETVAALDWLVGGLLPPADGVAAPPALSLPEAVKAHPTLARALPYSDRLATLLAEPRGGGHRRVALLKLAALLHDNAKPQTKVAHPDGSVSFYGHQELGAEVAGRIGRRLRLARRDVAYVTLVVREHMRPGQLRAAEVLTPRAVARFFRDLGDAGPDVLIHELADHLATRGPQATVAGWSDHLTWVRTLLDAYYAPAKARSVPLLTGHDLMAELGLAPGPRLGQILREIAEAQAAGEISSRDEALALARRVKGR